MAAYAATVTLDRPHAVKIGHRLGMLQGTANISNYNSTLAEITAITGQFTAEPFVAPSGLSTSGFNVAWDYTGKAFKCYGMGATATVGAELGNDTVVGHVTFVAIGLI